jgi:UDP-glucuronate 4-epimerase
VESAIRASDDIAVPDPNWDSSDPDPAGSNAPFRLLNIGNSSPTKLVEYVEVIEEILGRKAERHLLPLQAGDVPDTCADASELERQVGFRPVTPVREGIRAFVEWYTSYYVEAVAA